MKVAVITNDFSGFTGSEIVAMEVANHFGNRGHKVTIRAERHDDTLNQFLHRNVRIARQRIDICDYDLVWSQHGHFCLNIGDVKRLRKWKGKFVSVHLSAKTKGETYHYPFASRFSSLRVFNCEKAMEVLENGKTPAGKSFNLRNAAPDNFHNKPVETVNKLSKILIVSNHLPIEVKEAISLARSKGISVEHVGLEGSPRLIQPQDILNVDAVVSIGKTVQYALCSGRPVYCYDHWGGPGWLNDTNFDVAEYRNFSGLCHPEKKTGTRIVAELLNGFEDARQFATEKWPELTERYKLSTLLDEISTTEYTNQFDHDDCVDEIELMRGVMYHFDGIWRDVFSAEDLSSKKIRYNNHNAKDLENVLTYYLENPFAAIADTIKRKMSETFAAVIRPVSLRTSLRLRNSAAKRDPRRFRNRRDKL